MTFPALAESGPARRTWRSAALSFLLLGGLGVVVLFGAAALGVHDVRGVEPWIGAGVHGPWALPAAVASFAVLAFLGVPQFILIAATALAFGAGTGAVSSWIGTMVSALVGFALGRAFGGRLIGAGGPRVRQVTQLIARNGFLASLVVRLVPSAPFIVVNMAAGMTAMRLSVFAAGSGIGIVPKIALTAFAGEAALHGLNAQNKAVLLWLALAVVVWVGTGVAAQRWLDARRSRADVD